MPKNPQNYIPMNLQKPMVESLKIGLCTKSNIAEKVLQSDHDKNSWPIFCTFCPGIANLNIYSQEQTSMESKKRKQEH